MYDCERILISNILQLIWNKFNSQIGQLCCVIYELMSLTFPKSSSCIEDSLTNGSCTILDKLTHLVNVILLCQDQQ